MCFRSHPLLTSSVSRPRFGKDRHFDEVVSEMVTNFAARAEASSVITFFAFYGIGRLRTEV